jgi:hypothetical protein
MCFCMEVSGRCAGRFGPPTTLYPPLSRTVTRVFVFLRLFPTSRASIAEQTSFLSPFLPLSAWICGLPFQH